MKNFVWILAIAAIPSMSFAEEQLKPGSIYCTAVLAMETQNYQDQKNKTDKMLAPMVAEMKAFLAQITPTERAILEVEGSGSERLQDLWNRGKKLEKTYSNNLSECPLKGYWSQYEGSCVLLNKEEQIIKRQPLNKSGIKKSFKATHYFKQKLNKDVGSITISHHQLGEEKWYWLEIIPSTPEQEQLDIQQKIIDQYPAPTLKDHLQKVVNAKCLDEETLAHINDGDRTDGKDVPTGSKDNGKADKKSGAVKN